MTKAFGDVELTLLLLVSIFLIGCSETYTISGSAQKGPFMQGTEISIYELDASLNQTGISFQTETINDLGEYTLPVNLKSRYIEVFAEGFFFNEILGDVLPVDLSLSAIADATDNTSININFLTSLAKPRVRSLVSGGAPFEEAKVQAKNEILEIFGLPHTDTGLFEDMDILKDGDDNAILLAASSIIMQMAVKHEELYTPDLVPALTDILTSIKNDIQDDGILDDQFFNELILKAIHTFDTSIIRENLEIFILNADPGAVIPAFEILITENPLILTSAFTGDYEVSFSDGGTITGTVDLTIHNQLHITGTLHALIGDRPVAGGEVTEDGTLTFTVPIEPSLLQEFMGTIFEDGSVEGTCTLNADGEIHGPYPFSGHRL